MKQLKTLVLATAVCLSAPSAHALEQLWSVDGFDQPESVLFSDDRQALIVSNINGAPNEINGQGYLSLLGLDGQVIEKEWVTGLDAPKGMAIANGVLFVADMQRLHLIDVETGKINQSLTVDGAVFLNDVAADTDGNVYVSDFMAHRIYRYAGGTLAPWLEGEPLSHPNGIAMDGETLLVGNWGVGMQPDFSTQTPGSLLAISLADTSVEAVPGAQEIGNLDGVVPMEGSIFVSDWIAGKIFKVSEGERSEAGTFPAGLADIGGAQGILYLPGMLDGTVTAYKP